MNDGLRTYINFARLLVERDRRIFKEFEMGKLQEIAKRAPEVVAALEARADKLSQRLDALETKGASVFGRWDDHLAEQEKAVAGAENAINQLSNAPLSDSPPEQPFRAPGAGDSAGG